MKPLNHTFMTVIILSAFIAAPAASETPYSAETIQQATALRDQALTATRAYEIVESLTSEVGPRLAGSAGDALAVQWAQEKFKSLGFDKVWTEPVTFPTWTRGHSKAEIIAPTRQMLAVIALGGSIGTSISGIQGEIVQVKTYAELLEAHPDSIAGKIVFISNRMQKTQNGSGYSRAVIARSKGASAASRKGAIAIIIRSIGTDSTRLPHTGMMRYEKDIKPIPAAAISNPDADLLENLLARKQPVRIHLELGCNPGPAYTSANVIGEIRGQKKPDEIILLGAHLDSWDPGTGAIDDAAGVAIVMEAARLIGTLTKRPARTIRVVLYANEEQGVYGGKAYAQQHEKKINQHIAAAESDLGAGRIWKFSANTQPRAKKQIMEIANILQPLGIEHIEGETHVGADIEPLSTLGVGVFELSQDATLYFDYHHTANDTLDKIDPAILNQNVAAYAVFAYMAAQAKIKF